MHKEISALVDALKAGMMVVVKVPTKFQGMSDSGTSNNRLIIFQAALIASEVPVIVGEAPPSDYPHPGARRMFADGHTDFNGPPRAKPTTAATRVKKAHKGYNARTSSQQDEPHDEVRSLLQMPEPPPSRPFVVARKPSPHPVPPPSRPFVVVTKSPPHPAPPPSRPFVMATKPVMLDVISLSTSDSEEEPLEKPENGKGKKRRLKFAAASRTSKKHASSAEVAKDKNGETKGGPLSPLTVGSSSDELLAPAGQCF